MSDWKKDHGRTTRPTIYVPFNEMTTKSKVIPCRVGMTSVTVGSAYNLHSIDSFGHVYFPDTTKVASSYKVQFGNNTASLVNRFSFQEKIITPSYNVGNHIVFYAKMKLGETVDNFSNLVFFGLYNTGGIGIDTNKVGHIFRITTRNAGSFTNNQVNSITNAWTPDEWFHFVWTTEVTSSTSLTHRIYIANASGEYINSGNPVLTQTVSGAVSDFQGGNQGLGYESSGAIDIEDLVMLTVPIEESSDPNYIRDTVGRQLIDWYSSSSNKFQFPDFLRDPRAQLATQAYSNEDRVGVYASYWSLNGVGGESISGMYNWWLNWGVKNSIYDGICLGLGISAFQPTEGVYLVNEIREFADWCYEQGIGLKILINDQTYLKESELPDHFPHWKKHFLNGQGVLSVARAATYWDTIETFDLEQSVFSNMNWPIYDSSKSLDGTYRWFHHVWTLINALADKPAFKGVTTGETSGHAVGEQDGVQPNENGQFNRRGIYGITDADGVYLLDKCYSSLKQRLVLNAIMEMVDRQLKNRPDVTKSVQTNYFRVAIPGNNYTFYNNSTQTFTAQTGSAPHTPITSMFRNGDAVFLLSGSSGGIAVGMQYNTCYYVVNQVPGQEQSFQLSLTPNGPPITLTGDINASLWLIPINTYIELMQVNYRTPTVHNGYSLCADNREMRKLVEACHQFDFILSGPDVVTSALENLYYYTGAYYPQTTENPYQYSPVEIRLMALEGKEWFSDLGPMKSFEIQSQDSMYQSQSYGARLAAFVQVYGENFDANTYSLSQIHRYAVNRLKAREIVYFTNNEKSQKAIPALVEAICDYKLGY